MMKKHCVILLAVLSACLACQVDDAEYLVLDELGTAQKAYYIDSNIGSIEIAVYANKPGTVHVLEGASWLNVATPTFDGDRTLKLDYLYNEGFPRKGLVELRTETRRDTVQILQEGLIAEEVAFPQTSVIVYNRQGETALPAVCNIGSERVRTEIDYLDGNAWIRSVTLSSDKLVLSTLDNDDAAHTRKARIALTYMDGWGTMFKHYILVTQARADNLVGDLLSFEQLQAYAGTTRSYISNDWCIDAYVVSRPSSGNVGENAVLEMNYIDYDAETQTAYVESLDGSRGFRIRTVSAEDQVFKPDTRVRILLNGASILKEEDPERYTIYDVTSSMVIESVAAENEIPVKALHIADLKDSDIYTYVTLLDCEIPVRKGCLTPVNDGYTRLFGSDRVSKFPILIRDIQGSSMYMYTNTTCPYRRTGQKLPYGKGTISGVIVHEKYRSFIDHDDPDENRCGNIGAYQIRHMRYEDLALEDDIDGSFSALLTEYRYMKIPAVNPEHIWVPTYGENGYFSHSRASYIHTTYQTHGWAYLDYTYLGPCGNTNTGNVNGFGVILEDGTDYGADFPEANTAGKGSSAVDLMMSWVNTQWWFNGRGEAWLVCFSTEGVSSDHVSMQLSTQNISQTLRTPRYWKAEWSLTGDMSPEADAQWHLIADYVVPDVGINANTLVGQTLGYKQMDFPLPLDILGHKEVFIRLMPTRNAASSGHDYDSSTIANGNGNAINYFAIRYNK